MLIKLLRFLWSKDLRVFLIVSLFHLSLYFSPNNKVTFLLSVLLTIALYHSLRKIPSTLFYVFFTLLPFAKGKGLEIMLLDKKYVLRNAIFNIEFDFPIYFSSLYLALFYLHYLRSKLANLSKLKVHFNKTNVLAIGAFTLFIASTTINALNHIFYTSILLSSFQLLMLLLIFFLPFILYSQRETLKNFSQIIASSVIFQSVWLILQTLNKGYLGRDIEVQLTGFEYGVRSTENIDLMRLPGTFFESSILGTFLLTNLSVLLYLLAYQKITSKKERTIAIITLALGLLAIVLTGSRAIYGVTVLLFLIIAQLKGYLSKKGLKIVKAFIWHHKILIPVIIGSIIFVTPYLVNRLGSANQLFSKEGSGTYRIELTRLALRLTSKVPLLGVGLNLSPYYLATSFPQENYFVDPAHPHNLLIQILTETGVVGFALFCLFIYLIARPVLLNRQRINQFTIAALIFFALAQIYPIFINHMEIISFFFLYLGFTAHRNQEAL